MKEESMASTFHQLGSGGLLLSAPQDDSKRNLNYGLLRRESSSAKELFWTSCYLGPSPIAATNAENRESCQLKNHLLLRTLPRESEIIDFAASLKVCAKSRDLQKGAKLHEDILKQGLQEECCDALVLLYARCGALAKAKELLDLHKCKNVASWTALIAGYTRQGRNKEALNCFDCMQHQGLSPNRATFSCILKACGSLSSLEKGKHVHEMIARQGLLVDDVILGTSLVDMYAKCGALAKAHHVLEELPDRDLFSWSALIAGYAQHGQGEQALECFERLKHEGLAPDAVTYACVLRACGTIGAIVKGEQIHEEIARQGLLDGDVVLGTALVDMYARCGVLVKANIVLEELPSRDVYSWGALIAGYVEHGHGEKALTCYKCMQQEGFSPDAAAYSCILRACGIIGAIDKGELIHDEIARKGLLESNELLSTALVGMYAKCGSLSKAHQLIHELPVSNVVAWSALVMGYAQQGQVEQAIYCFRQMQHEGFTPNAVTFSCMLNACTHLGLVEEGHECFVAMNTLHGVKPNLEHYVSMIDLYGRTGHLERAVKMIQEMPSSNHSSVWHSLLSGCLKWGDVEIASWALQQAVRVDKSDGPAYILMANIYANAGRHRDAEKVEAMRLKNTAQK